MCSSVPVLRLLPFLLLLVAFVACFIGFFSPFWIEYHPPTTSSTLPSQSSDAPSTTTSSPPVPPSTSVPSFAVSSLTDQMPPSRVRNNTVRNGDGPPAVETLEQRGGKEEEEDVEEDEEEPVSSSMDGGSGRVFEGLWARCDENYVCRCFAQDNFQMEKEFPDWHKAAQGLFTVGLLFLLITLLIGGFYLCCRCCRDSVVLATVLGAFALAGFLPIAISIIVYGGFANQSLNIEMAVVGNRFVWGYFLSIAGTLVVPLAAILYFLDGRRKEIIEHEDCETAKMV